MARPAGKPKTGGRKKGTPNKITVAREAKIRASGLTPLGYMLKVMRDESNPQDIRLDAAYKAAPYVHAKLASVELTGNPEHPVEQRVTVVDEKAVAAAVERVESEY